VSAVNGSGEGTLSSDSVVMYFANGIRIGEEDRFNGTISYADTTAPTASPLGFGTNAKWSVTPGNTIMNPYSGMGAVDQNLNIRGFNYLVLNIYSAQSGSSFHFSPEVSGDQPLLTGSLASATYTPGGGALPANQWTTLRVPLSQLMIDQLDSTYPNAPQYAFYKVTLGSDCAGPNGCNETFWVEWYFSVH